VHVHANEEVSTGLLCERARGKVLHEQKISQQKSIANFECYNDASTQVEPGGQTIQPGYISRYLCLTASEVALASERLLCSLPRFSFMRTSEAYQVKILPPGFFYWICFFWGIGPRGLAPPSPLECNSILPLVTAVLITPKGAEPPGSRRIGVIGALVLILPSETV